MAISNAIWPLLGKLLISAKRTHAACMQLQSAGRKKIQWLCLEASQYITFWQARILWFREGKYHHLFPYPSTNCHLSRTTNALNVPSWGLVAFLRKIRFQGQPRCVKIYDSSCEKPLPFVTSNVAVWIRCKSLTSLKTEMNTTPRFFNVNIAPPVAPGLWGHVT